MKRFISATFLIAMCLALCLLPRAVYGEAADADAIAYEQALIMLNNSSLTDLGKLKEINITLEPADGFSLGAEYLAFTDALIILRGEDANGYDLALNVIRRLSDNEKFTTDYGSQLDRTGKHVLPDLERLLQYVKARKLETYGKTKEAIALYDRSPELDAITRAADLSGSLNETKYSKAIELLLKGTLVSLQEAEELFLELGDFRDSSMQLAECQNMIIKLGTPVPSPIPVAILQPPASLTLSVSSEAVILHWIPVMGAEKYEVSRADGVSGIFKSFATVEGTEYMDTSVFAGRTYLYQIISIRDAQKSAPTATAEAVMQKPATEPTMEMVLEPTSKLEPTPMPDLTARATSSSDPSRLMISETAYQGSHKLTDYVREIPINVQGGDLFTFYPGGVFTFRNDGMRQNAAFGNAEMPMERLSVIWESRIGNQQNDTDFLSGLGWTGQPAIIKWFIEMREMMNLNAEKKATKVLKEVIFAAQDGKVYFLDLYDGQPTRDPIDIGYPLKGSVAVDGRGRPMIAFGQSSMLPGKTDPIGYYIYNLLDQTQLSFIDGHDTENLLQNADSGSFDGTGLFDWRSDHLVFAGGKGLLYTIKLNTEFDFTNAKTLSIEPEIIYLHSKGSQPDNTVSIEASAAMYGPYAFVADKQGILRCVDTTTMQTVWAFDTGNSTDATPALDLEEGNRLALYTGTTLHSRPFGDGNVVIRRLDALSGDEIWSFKVKAQYDANERSGVKASPVVGQGEIGHLVIFTVNLTEEGGAILALDKRTGAEVWKVPLPSGAISSPIAVYASDGRARLIQADLLGRLHLINALTGEVVFELDLDSTIEGSPAVYNDILVIGTSDMENSRMVGIRLE